MVSDRCAFCRPVSLVYCGQTVGWINKPVCTKTGLRPATLCYMGKQLPLPKWAEQHLTFRPLSIVAKRLGGSGCHLVRRYRPRPRPHCVGWGLRSTRKGAQRSFTFRPMSIVAKRSPTSATAELLLRYRTVCENGTPL